jgi:Fe-S-cluster containining protein
MIANVPCNGCRLCCQRELVMLFPEEGDDVSSYVHEIMGPMIVLKRRPNGDCVYLGDGGCTIHDRAPVMCKAFDCRLNFLKYSRNERRVMVRDGLASKELFEAGRKRLASLVRQS